MMFTSDTDITSVAQKIQRTTGSEVSRRSVRAMFDLGLIRPGSLGEFLGTLGRVTNPGEVVFRVSSLSVQPVENIELNVKEEVLSYAVANGIPVITSIRGYAGRDSACMPIGYLRSGSARKLMTRPLTDEEAHPIFGNATAVFVTVNAGLKASLQTLDGKVLDNELLG